MMSVIIANMENHADTGGQSSATRVPPGRAASRKTPLEQKDPGRAASPKPPLEQDAPATQEDPGRAASPRPPLEQESPATQDASPQPSTPAEPSDRRSLRSRRLLRTAFAELAGERGLGGFSVGELAERADLNRGTFYAHFTDMDDLLTCSENEIIDDLLLFEDRIKGIGMRELLAAGITGKPPAVAIELFDVLRGHGPLLRVLLGERGDAAFQARLRDGVCANLVRTVLHSKYRDTPSALTEYYVAYYAAASLGLIQHWLERGMPESSAAIARILLGVMFLKPGDPIKVKGVS